MWEFKRIAQNSAWESNGRSCMGLQEQLKTQHEKAMADPTKAMPEDRMTLRITLISQQMLGLLWPWCECRNIIYAWVPSQLTTLHTYTRKLQSLRWIALIFVLKFLMLSWGVLIFMLTDCWTTAKDLLRGVSECCLLSICSDDRNHHAFELSFLVPWWSKSREVSNVKSGYNSKSYLLTKANTLPKSSNPTIVALQIPTQFAQVHATILLVLESLDRFQSLRRRREETQTQKNNGVQERKRFSPCSGCNCDKKLLNSKAGEQQQWAATTYHGISPKDSIIEILWNHPSKDHNKRKHRIRRTRKICLYTTWGRDNLI